jgi:hypothetical protein
MRLATVSSIRLLPATFRGPFASTTECSYLDLEAGKRKEWSGPWIPAIQSNHSAQTFSQLYAAPDLLSKI